MSRQVFANSVKTGGRARSTCMRGYFVCCRTVETVWICRSLYIFVECKLLYGCFLPAFAALGAMRNTRQRRRLTTNLKKPVPGQFPGSVHSAAPSQGVKVGIESRHRQPQRVLRASSPPRRRRRRRRRTSTAELSTVKLNPV